MSRLGYWLPRLFVVFLLLLGGWGTAVAKAQAFTSTANPTYGQEVAFQLTGQVSAEVEQVKLFINYAGSATPLSVEVQRFAQDEAGQLVADYDLNPALAELPPFAKVQFWWELKTADAETILVPEETFTYRDDRFEWRTLSEGDVTVYWTGNDAELGQLAWEIVVDSRQTLDNILPPTAVSPLEVYVYPATSDLRAGLRLAGHDWHDGHTDPDLGVLLVTAVNRLTAAADLRQSIPHELTHLRLYQLAPTAALPTWYTEGIALLAEENGGGGDDLLETAVADDAALPLLALCTNFPEEAPESDLALAQSVSLLRYIQAQFGDQALRQLGTAYLSGGGCGAGLTQTMELSLAELNADWLRVQAPQPAWLVFLNQNGLWLLLLLGSFSLLLLLIRK